MSAKSNLIRPTPDEDARINQGIAQDPDNPEWTKEDWKAARPASETMPEAVKQLVAAQRHAAEHERPKQRVRGKQKAPTKLLVALCLDRDLVSRLCASGPGWQSRANDALRKAILGR